MKPLSERLIEHGLMACAAVSSLVTVSILVFMLVLGFPLLADGGFFVLFVTPWDPGAGLLGIRPMIAGTLAIAPLALVIALPPSLGTAALIAARAPGFATTALRGFVQFMTGIPTVVYGFIGIFLLVPFIRKLARHGSGLCVLSAALLLSLLIAPTLILFFTDAFKGVPRTHILAVRALGASNSQVFSQVMLPGAWRGVLGGVILATGRAFGDTMIALMIAGNAAREPRSLFDPARALTSHIALIKAADYHSLEFKSIFACGLALYLIAAVLVVIFRRLQRAPGRAQ